MVLNISHNELKIILKENYKKKISLMIYGTFGVGKSFVVRETSKEIAESRAREFVEWNKLSKEQKEKVFAYPEKYFVLIDIRLSSYDSSDLRGLPDFRNNKEIVDWKIPYLCKFLTLPDSDGILFFDEIGLATPLVMASCYQILYDKVINEEKMSNLWLTIGATNLSSDRAYTHEIAPPLKDRCSEVELKVPNVEDWTTDFAIPNNLDSRIIGFVNFKPSSLHKVDFNDNQKFVTPRSWERVSILIKDIKDWNVITLICKSAMGEGVGSEFIAFCKIQEKLKLEEIIKNPSKIEKIDDISVKYFLVSAVAERYKDKKLDFEKVMDISIVLDKIENAEFTALLWRLSSSYTDNFKKDFLKSKGHDKFISKYGKFLI